MAAFLQDSEPGAAVEPADIVEEQCEQGNLEVGDALVGLYQRGVIELGHGSNDYARPVGGAVCAQT